MSNLSLLFFTILNLLNYLDRNLIAAVLPQVIASLALSNEEGGRLVSAFVLGYFIFSPIFGCLGDRLSRPKLMAVGVFIWSISTVATGFADTFLAILLIRTVVGIGEASFGTIAPGYLKDRLADPIRVNTALSIFFAAIPVGTALGYVTGGFIAEHYSWQSAFFVGGIPGLILVAFLLAFKERRPVQNTPVSIRLGLREIANVPMLWYAIGGYGVNAFALNGIAAFITTYGVATGFTLKAINLYFGIILVITGLFGTIVGGKLASRLAQRSKKPLIIMLRYVAVSALLGAPFLAAALFAKSHTLFLVLCAIAELVIFAGVAPLNSIVVLASPPALVTLTQGITIFFINIVGSLLAPIIIGALADRVGLALGLQLSSVALLISGIIWGIGAIHLDGRGARELELRRGRGRFL